MPAPISGGEPAWPTMSNCMTILTASISGDASAARSLERAVEALIG